MKSVAASIVLIALLVATGGLAWVAGQSEERLAVAEYSLVTLRYQTAAGQIEGARPSPLLQPVLRPLGVGTDDALPTARYWLGDYESLKNAEETATKLLAVNADYRALRAAGGPWQFVVGRLDTIAKRYADILRTEPSNEDAAYNFEYIVRVRAAVVATKKPLPPANPADSGLTVHGVPGGPPEETEGKKFKMIVPMLPDERQEAEEAGRQARKVRKG